MFDDEKPPKYRILSIHGVFMLKNWYQSNNKFLLLRISHVK